jgi:hypothetical protein
MAQPQLWTRQCPMCLAMLTKPRPDEPWHCTDCGWGIPYDTPGTKSTITGHQT